MWEFSCKYSSTTFSSATFSSSLWGMPSVIRWCMPWPPSWACLESSNLTRYVNHLIWLLSTWLYFDLVLLSELLLCKAEPSHPIEETDWWGNLLPRSYDHMRLGGRWSSTTLTLQTKPHPMQKAGILISGSKTGINPGKAQWPPLCLL